jgi:4-carboxymuconolactone decarboxylase
MDDAQHAEQGMFERGMKVRREVLGNAHVDRAIAGTTEFTAPFQDFITRYAWGEIWSRPGLTRQERSIVTLTVLAALQHEEELAMHVKAALRNGLSEAQIQEVLLQVGLYAGVPVANRAFAIAKRVLESEQEGLFSRGYTAISRGIHTNPPDPPDYPGLLSAHQAALAGARCASRASLPPVASAWPRYMATISNSSFGIRNGLSWAIAVRPALFGVEQHPVFAMRTAVLQTTANRYL